MRPLSYYDAIDEEYTGNEYEEMRHGVCKHCGSECLIITIDEGIGQYEYWGMIGRHHDYRDVSDCCHADFEAL